MKNHSFGGHFHLLLKVGLMALILCLGLSVRSYVSYADDGVPTGGSGTGQVINQEEGEGEDSSTTSEPTGDGSNSEEQGQSGENSGEGSDDESSDESSGGEGSEGSGTNEDNPDNESSTDTGEESSEDPEKDKDTVPDAQDGMAQKKQQIKVNTVYNGLDYAPVFDIDYYMDHYADIKTVFGNDPQGAFEHFIQYGMAEGRRGCEKFNVYAYANRYLDLQKAFKGDLPAYYRHYCTYGYAEGRNASDFTDSESSAKNTSIQFKWVNTIYQGIDYSPVFDVKYYMAQHPELNFGGDQQKAFNHFIQTGMQKGYRGCENFNVFAYANRYRDLQKAFKGDLKSYYRHYCEYGAAEHRNGTDYTSENDAAKNTSIQFNWANTVYQGVDYAPVFDALYYLNKYPDLAAKYGSDQQSAFVHFRLYGMQEGRQACENFNVNAYANRYLDLQKAFKGDKPAYYRHYCIYGCKEKRSGLRYTSGDDAKKNTSFQFNWANTVYKGVNYAPVFDALYYLENHSDVAAKCGSDQQAAFQHFVNSGMNDGYRGNASFNVFAYANRNDDLQNSFGWDLAQYYKHYCTNGRYENRVIAEYPESQKEKNSELAFYKYNGRDYSPVFDPDYYRTMNPDVVSVYGSSGTKLFKHFISYGMKEGRQGCADFNVFAYANRYVDLQYSIGRDKLAYYNHYFEYGLKENRSGKPFTDSTEKNTKFTFYHFSAVYNGVDYTPVFDPLYYLAHHTDAKSACGTDQQQAFNHFINVGMKKGYQAAPEFNPYAYANRYVDLQKTYKGDITGYYRHYCTAGIREGRSGSEYPGNDARNTRFTFSLQPAYQRRMDSIAANMSSATSWCILVDTKSNHVGIYHRSGGRWQAVHYWSCDTGAPGTETPLGYYSVGCKGYSFGTEHGYTCYYYTGFIGGMYLFHSLLYAPGTFNLMDDRLGMNISHGCIRLAIQNAHWIYANIPVGSRVYTYR